jgi:glycosyltransferase involved in cell wall biosynthesis
MSMLPDSSSASSASSLPTSPTSTSRSTSPVVGEGRPLRILMVLESDFTQRGGGGAESQLRTLALHLKRLGQQVSVITPLLPYGPQVTCERPYGIPVGRIRYPRRPFVGGAVMCLRFAAFLWQHGRRYDAWHIHIGHHLGAVTCLAGVIMGKPVVLKISGWWELEKGLMSSTAKPLDVIARSLLKRATAVQAISTRIAGELRRHGFPAERIMVLPNAVDTSRFHVRTTPRPADAPFTAVFVGRLVAEKGLVMLLDAWAEAFRGRSDVWLRLVAAASSNRCASRRRASASPRRSSFSGIAIASRTCWPTPTLACSPRVSRGFRIPCWNSWRAVYPRWPVG